MLSRLYYGILLLFTEPNEYFEDTASVRRLFIDAWVAGAVVTILVSLAQFFAVDILTRQALALRIASFTGLSIVILPFMLGGWSSLFYSGSLLLRSPIQFEDGARIYLKIFPLIIFYWLLSILVSLLGNNIITTIIVSIILLHIVWLLGTGYKQFVEESWKAYVMPVVTILLGAVLVSIFIGLAYVSS